ncbi:bacillithiol biosynthesis cysteine-adding enzyme BshC [Paenibacillus sp. J5C_2022]|uniref:bacillithiol biosynthesis cysteine-adding enzyme BshC n=1 Tax=Paenibacillus sp. J5C2022 TaxID=2977129 RepID=UPI0021D23929|nr:bacillithiol biosynthesis cysteine-adding enzyme BshC [Paenibacillus sp. J5C2022]MCU6709488.1 bacillithiol biosynthesis cysteine-adding enzyme BshC [Paenibacillus sp. J5C2022]
MQAEPYSLPSSQPLTEAYISRNDPGVMSLYGYHAGEAEDWSRRHAVIQRKAGPRVDAALLADVLRAYQRRIGSSDKVQCSIDAIAEGAPVIIGGQQAGLWTGPLLVVHKAVSIIRSAGYASEQLGIPVIPVFWIAGEDHDWDEANHAYVVTAEQELGKLTAAMPERVRTSVSRTIIGSEQWESWLAELEAALPGSEFKPGMMEELRQLADRTTSLSDMFACLLHRLFGRYGLVLIDSDDAGLRKLEAPMFRELLERNDELEEAFRSTSARVKELGYPLQADVAEGSSGLFLFHPDRDGERTMLYKRDGLFEDRKGSSSWSKEELIGLTHSRPELFSNNVLTRPLMQEYLFPVLGTVLGPGEIAYWGATGAAFRLMEMEMPIIVPRMSYTLVEGTVAKHMAKFELDFADVMERFQERKEQWLKEQDELSLQERFSAVSDSFQNMYRPLLELAASIQPGLTKLGETNMAKIVEQIAFMESRTLDAHHKRFEAAIRQLERIRLSIKPADKPQERVLSMIGYWSRYGESWLEELMEADYRLTGGHEIVYL